MLSYADHYSGCGVGGGGDGGDTVTNYDFIKKLTTKN